MDGRPIHYDGSALNHDANENEFNTTEPFKLNDEVRKSLSGNPYSI